MHKSVAITPDERRRFVLVDALRGIGALWVFYFHLLNYHPLHTTLLDTLPSFVTAPGRYGGTRVAGFFVLSGFVIAHSVRATRLSPLGIARFAVRRHIRLDPTYWAAIALSAVLLVVEKLIPHTVTPPMYSASELLENGTYLHKIIGSREIISPAWTLCIEVQLYLVFIVLLAISPGRTPAGQDDKIQRVGWAPWLTLILAAISIGLEQLGYYTPAWFLPFWPHFSCGVLCYWALSTSRARVPFLFLAAYLMVAGTTRNDIVVVVTACVGVLLYVAGRRGGLTSWMNGPVFQYLGRISYGLYLFHMLIAYGVLRLGYKLTGTNRPAALAWMAVAIGASLFVAHIVNVIIEQPSIRLSARLKAKGTST